MPDNSKSLGKPVAVHGMAPAYVQRALFLVVLSFLFFMAMMFAYYIRQNVGYFLLASAFLVLYVVMLISWVLQRRNFVTIFERGISYKNQLVGWGEITGISTGGVITVADGKDISLPQGLHLRDDVINTIRGHVTVTE